MTKNGRMRIFQGNIRGEFNGIFIIYELIQVDVFVRAMKYYVDYSNESTVPWKATYVEDYR